MVNEETDQDGESWILQELHRFASSGAKDDDNDDDEESKSNGDPSASNSDGITSMAMPVAAMNVLLRVVERSTANTMMGLEKELREAAQIICSNNNINNNRILTLQSGCDLFLKYTTRTFLELPHFEACRKELLTRGQRLAHVSLLARDRIAQHGQDFIPDGSVVLLHGWSRVVAALLNQVSRRGRHLRLYILEGQQQQQQGHQAAQYFSQVCNIPTTLVPDGAMGFIMERVDMVLVGAEGVVENGGIVNTLGTHALAICAHVQGIPFYVAAESYKFARLYPLTQMDIPQTIKTTTITSPNNDNKKTSPQGVKFENPQFDYTPAKFITLLFTDLGVLTPSAVSDELIRLYQ